MRALQGPRADRIRSRIDEIDALLARDTRVEKAPVWRGGERVGTTERALPLLPSERALHMARRRRLRESLDALAPPELRRDFLAMLPGYAEQHGFDREIMLAVGVPARDLDEAGIAD